MIYVTGDCHKEFCRFNTTLFPEQKGMTKDDYMIICGDFGGIWTYKEPDKNELWWLNWLERLPFTVMFVDGNHENFDRLNAFPEEEWNGGIVHKISPHIIHLMRGYVYEIDGVKIFTFGGGRSHDISDGIIERDDLEWKAKVKELERNGRYMYRVRGLTWWEQELPSQEEMERGLENLKKHDFQVDFVISHCPPASIIGLMGQGKYEQDELSHYLENIKQQLFYRGWFMGHLHMNKRVTNRDYILYEQIMQIK